MNWWFCGLVAEPRLGLPAGIVQTATPNNNPLSWKYFEVRQFKMDLKSNDSIIDVCAVS